MKYLLINKQTSNHDVVKRAEEFKNELEGDSELLDCRELDYKDFFSKLNSEDEVYLVGGDGTLNYFINHVDTDNLKNNVYLLPCGTGNDFAHDVNDGKDEPILLNKYVKNLPTVEVKDIKAKFINGIGFGIDGYCCEVGDKERAKGKQDINYTSIAIKGLLFHFKKVTAQVTVDGETHEFKQVWLAPSMKGKYYGGGMIIAPDQDRYNSERTVTNVVMHKSGKLHTLMVFPKIFKGEHIKHKKMVDVRVGKHVIVEFDKPTALQIDGETIKGVLKYEVVID